MKREAETGIFEESGGTNLRGGEGRNEASVRKSG